MREQFSMTPLGEGLDNLAYEVNGMFVVRFSKEGMGTEAQLLEFVRHVSPLPVPEPVYADEHCMAYPKLPGAPMSTTDQLPELAGFLAALHAVPRAEVEHLVEEDLLPLEAWRDEATEVATRLGYAHLTGQLQDLPEPAAELVFSHNDLGVEHVLVHNGAISGVIDWTDAAICDPAYDYGKLYRDLGPEALGICPDHLRQRAIFYARCTIFEDIEYGRDTRPLDRLFQ